MKNLLLPSILISALLVAVFASFSTAEGFEWAETLTAAFEKGNESNRLVVVLASEKLTDEGAASVAAFLEDSHNASVASLLTGVRLSGDKAVEFSATYGIESLPILAVLHPNCKLIGHREATDEELLRDLTSVVSRGFPVLPPQRLPGMMKSAADSLEGGDAVSGILAQQLALHSLDALIEEAKSAGGSASSAAQQRQDPQAGESGESNGGDASGSAAGGDASEVGDREGRSSGDVSSASWGNLPPKLREDVSNVSSDEIPNAYRELVEEYFKSLMSE